MENRWHVLELVVATLLTAVAIAWLIAFLAAWTMQGRLSSFSSTSTSESREVLRTQARNLSASSLRARRLRTVVIDLREPLEEIMTLLSYRVDKNGSRGVRDLTTIIRGAQDA
jgi:hypothetical protein